MKLKPNLLLFFFLLTSVLFGQQLDMEVLKNLKARNIGPAGMSGRVTAIDVVTANPDIMYVGTASGGLWKSTSGGIDWEPIFENETTASIGAVAIQQSNPSVIWVGTGEGNPRNSLNGGDGIYRSLDGGKTWKKMGLEKTRHIHRVRIDPTNPNIIYAGAIGSPWGEYEDRGVYKTVDGGKTWKKILYTNKRSGCAELVMDPTNPNKLIAALWEHKRDPWFFQSGGSGSGLYVTYDGGETWDKKTSEDGIPAGDLGRIGIAIAPSSPNKVYALIESKKNALYGSEDGGETWKKINDKSEIGNRPFYYHEIYVDPVNENRIYSIFTYVNVSEDGGKSFRQLMPAYGVDNGVHPDHHAWYIHPDNPNLVMDGNDGGLNISRDRGKTWRFVENLPVGQFYHVAVDNEYPYNVYGGMQDNGSWAGPAYVWKAQGIRNQYFQEISFGDGFDVLPDPTNSRYGISTSQQGNAGIYDRLTGNFEGIRPTYPEGDVPLRFNWNVGLARDPFNASTVYFGSQFVHKSTDGGQNWTIISPDLTTNDPAKQKQGDSGGLTMDATGAENYCTIIVIEPSTKKKDVLWIGTDDGNVQITQNGGKTWTDVTSNIPGLPRGSWITQIKASNKNEGEALLVANDYRRFNYEPYAYRTRDYGKTWERIVDGNDVISYALSIVEDPVSGNLLFLGTDDGLYVSIDAGKNWTKWTNGFPTTNAYDMVIHPREHDLVIATFGRSFYVLDDIRPLRELAQSGMSLLNKKLHVFDPPTAYVPSFQQPNGTRFGADAMYNGENRPSGAMLTYVINQPGKEKPAAPVSKKRGKKGSSEPAPTKSDDKVKYDSLKIEIFKGDQLLKTIAQKAPKESGVMRYYWNMREKGAYRMTRGKLNRRFEPSGVSVLPGEYKVRFSFGDQKDSTLLKVEYDPRLEWKNSDLQSIYSATKELEANYGRGVEAVERLKEAKKIASDMKKALKEKDSEGYKDQMTLCEDQVKKIDEMLDRFLGPQDDRQGITRNFSLPLSINANYRFAYRYVVSASHAPGQTENKLIEKFESSLEEGISAVNAYFSGDWLTYREEMEKINLSPFKDYSDIE